MTDEYASSSSEEAEHEAEPVFTPYDAPAGGWGALRAVTKALREQSVVLKGSRSFLSMNQPDGFDCPGCAWAEAIFMMGQNPGTNSPRMMTELHNASRRGRADCRV
jgi:hypothetical protein